MVAIAPRPARLAVRRAWLVALALCLLGCGEDADDMADIAADEERQSRIAFVSNRDGYQRIYVMDADGGNQRPLTDPEYGEDTHPVWSPDGTTLAFISTSDAGSDIHLVDANGTNRRNLTNSRDLRETAIAWSPDSGSVAYFATAPEADGRGYIRALDSVYPEPANLWGWDINRLDWSPDGESFVYRWRLPTEQCCRSGVTVKSVDGASSLEIGTRVYQPSSPAWSRNGLAIAMSAAGLDTGHILVTDAEGANPRLYHPPPGSWAYWPTWSPDGREIAYAGGYKEHHVTDTFEYPGRSDIWTINLQDRSHRQLTNSRDYDGMPAWSP